jgi:hypothetical protein
MSDGVIKGEDRRGRSEGVTKKGVVVGKNGKEKEKQGEDFFHYQKSKNQKNFFFIILLFF